MSISTADRVLEDFVTTWSSHDPEKILPLYADDCIYEDVTMGVVNHGKDELRTFGELIFSGFPDIAFGLASQVVAGDRAAGEWTMTGTHLGNLPGLPATGKSISVRGATVLELQDGRIRRCSDYWDMTTLLKQVGLPPEQQAGGEPS